MPNFASPSQLTAATTDHDAESLAQIRDQYTANITQLTAQSRALDARINGYVEFGTALGELVTATRLAFGDKHGLADSIAHCATSIAAIMQAEADLAANAIEHNDSLIAQCQTVLESLPRPAKSAKSPISKLN